MFKGYTCLRLVQTLLERARESSNHWPPGYMERLLPCHFQIPLFASWTILGFCTGPG